MITKETVLAYACDADWRRRLPDTVFNQLFVTRRGDIISEQEANCLLIAQHITSGIEVIVRALRLS